MSKRISFDRSLYLPEAVEAAAAAYAEYAEIDVTLTADAVVAVISGVSEHDPEMVANAFCNHVLHETIARLRQAPLREVG
jgi:glycerophosphoryl diester phosphodiesterase